jgi:hypothetical protein
MASIYQDQRRSKTLYSQKVNQLNKHLDMHHVSRHLKRRAIQHLDYFCREGIDNQYNNITTVVTTCCPSKYL